MSAAKHSPAPWKIDGEFDAGVNIGILDADGNEILGISPMDGENLDEWGDLSIANARLIAAAPDLLEACRTLFEDFAEAEACYCGQLIGGCDSDGQPREICGYHLAEKAIKKAGASFIVNAKAKGRSDA